MYMANSAENAAPQNYPKSWNLNSSAYKFKLNQISIWICTARYREMWVSRYGGFRKCSTFRGNCHICMSNIDFTWMRKELFRLHMSHELSIVPAILVLPNETIGTSPLWRRTNVYSLTIQMICVYRSHELRQPYIYESQTMQTMNESRTKCGSRAFHTQQRNNWYLFPIGISPPYFNLKLYRLHIYESRTMYIYIWVTN